MEWMSTPIRRPSNSKHLFIKRFHVTIKWHRYISWNDGFRVYETCSRFIFDTWQLRHIEMSFVNYKYL